jgi:trimethylamine--corrinoid protein Co-methyltransferase
VREQIPVETVRPSLRMLSDEGVRNIHNASLEILEKTGIEMQDSHGRELLLEAGAWESGGRIHVPERIVENALSSAPSRIPMHDRLGRLAMPLELGKVYFGPGSDTTFTLDLESGERRRATAQDAENMAHVADALGNLDFVMSMSNPSDVEIDDLYL